MLHPRASAYSNVGSISMIGDISAAEACVAATATCNETLLDGLDVLEGEVDELIRLSKSVTNQRLFVLLPEKRVRAYATQQNEDIEPQINELLELAEKSLKVMERKEATLKSKIASLQQRPSETPVTAKNDARKSKLLIKQRQMLEKELLALENEAKALQRQAEESGLA